MNGHQEESTKIWWIELETAMLKLTLLDCIPKCVNLSSGGIKQTLV
jgi:hypothetical protein